MFNSQPPTPSSALQYTFWIRPASPILPASTLNTDPSDLANNGNTMCFVGVAVSHAQEAYCQAEQYIDNTTCTWMLHLLPIRWRMYFSRHVRLALMKSCIRYMLLGCVPKRVSNNSVYVCLYACLTWLSNGHIYSYIYIHIWKSFDLTIGLIRLTKFH